MSPSVFGANLRVYSMHFDQLIKQHNMETMKESSSDEEDWEGKQASTRQMSWRWNKKSKRKTLGIESGSVTTTTNGSEVVLDMKGSFYSEKGKVRKTMNKMLSSPETLAVLCANRGDILEIKNLIKVSKNKLMKHKLRMRYG